MTACLPPPTLATVSEYGARLGDAGFWAPYVTEALARHGLPAAALEAGVLGTFPTFLAGRYVVKLFGKRFWGEICHAVELSVHRVLLAHPELPAPALVAHGRLFGEGCDGGGSSAAWPWPYLITTRLPGTVWRDAELGLAEQEDLARQLGSIVRRVHELPPPTGPVWERDWLAEFRADCVDRHRRWGTLPAHLITEIEGYLAEPSPVRCLIHADLHEDHLFVDRVDGARLVGIIDWGDALVADPYYELPALHLGTFRGNRRLLQAFLEGYGWKVGADFSRRAMSMTLVHEFDVLRKAARTIELRGIRALDEFADLLWELP